MKKVIKKDLKDVLPSAAMMVVTFVILECGLLAGVVVRNAKLISTCITIAAFAAAVTLVYHLYSLGRVLLRNLRERQYFYDLRSEGVDKYKVVIWKLTYTFLSLMAFAVLYVGALYLDIRLFMWAFPSEREGLAKFGVRKMIVGDGDSFVPALFSTIFEYATAGLLLLTLVLAVVTFTYKLFWRSKLCGFNCVLVYLVMFGAFLKVYSATIAGKSGIALHMIAGAMQLALSAVFFGFALYQMRKIVPDTPTPES